MRLNDFNILGIQVRMSLKEVVELAFPVKIVHQADISEKIIDIPTVVFGFEILVSIFA